jgi:flagellar assembly protein FliH
VELVAPPPAFGIDPVGPWARDLSEAFEAARREGFAQGRADGLAEGREQYRGEATEQAGRFQATFERTLQQIGQQMEEQAARLSAEVVDLGLELASLILDREIASATNPGAEAVARCLAVAPAEGDLVVHLHPDDAALLGQIGEVGGRALTIRADERIERGDAVVRIDETLIDGRIAHALERVAEVLR